MAASTLATELVEEPECSNSKIMEYIKGLGYGDEVQAKVEGSKVSGATINLFKKEDFLDMGLALAHAYQVMSKFKKDSKTERLTQLMITARSRPDTSKVGYSRKRMKPHDISIVFTWYNFDKKKNKFTQVREIMGGGRRVQVMARTSNLQEVLSVAKNMFFPFGKSVRNFNLNDCSYYLADFALTKLEDNAFTLGDYKKNNSLKQAKVSLMTKKLNPREKFRTVFTVSDENSSESDDDFSMDLPSFSSLRKAKDKPQSLELRPLSTSTPETESVVQRRELIREQDNAFKESLKADQEKDEAEVTKLESVLNDTVNNLQSSAKERADKLKKKIADLQHKENIRKARLDRLPPEPELSDECVVICVNHLTLGRIQRSFSPSDRIQAVYDWVGSLCHEPVHFKLSLQFTQTTLNPEDVVVALERNVLNMIESDEPVDISPDESVTFLGHHITNKEEIYNIVENKRNKVQYSLSTVIKTIHLSRNNVLDDMMQMYTANEDILRHRVVVRFENESASGDGVAREAYSLFVDELLLKTCDGTMQFIPIVQPEFADTEFEIVGYIFYHFFVNFGLFPIHFARASMEYAFYGKCSNSSLLESFFAFISKTDADILSSAIFSGSFVRDGIVNILSNYGIRTLPTKQNITELVCKAAKNELITKPLPALLAIKRCFNGFFDELSNASLASVYEVATPTNAKVAEYISYPEPVDRMEEKAFGFVQRFINEANLNVLQDFLKFTSGSSFILPGVRIGLTSEIMGEIESRPIAKTCVKLLTIPRNIQTYHAFQKTILYYIGHSEYWAMED